VKGQQAYQPTAADLGSLLEGVLGIVQEEGTDEGENASGNGEQIGIGVTPEEPGPEAEGSQQGGTAEE
jgi:hypothetical protein